MRSISNSRHIFCDFGSFFTVPICNVRQLKVMSNLLTFVYLHSQISNVIGWYHNPVWGQRVWSMVTDCDSAVTTVAAPR
jgi:hypothetical protein